jgi:transposase
MVVVDGQGVPLGGTLASASPAEVKLAEETLAQIRVPRKGPGRPKQRPRYVIADKAYDSDPLRYRLQDRGIKLVVPYRRNRKNKPGPKQKLLGKYRRRWIVERTFAWISNFRRLTVRYERSITVYRAFFHIACALITLRHF